MLPHVDRISGVLLVVAGLYVAWYGWFEIRVFAGRAASNPVVDAALPVLSRLACGVDDLGPLLLLGALVALAGALALVRRRRMRERASGSGREALTRS